MNTPVSVNNRFNASRIDPLVRHWLLRLFVPMGMAQECLEERRSYRSADRDYVNALAERFDAGDQWFCEAKDVISPKNTIASTTTIVCIVRPDPVYAFMNERVLLKGG